MNLGEIAPTIEALIALEPDELGLRLLPLLYGDGRQGRSVSLRGLMEHNFPYVYAGDRRAYKGGPYPGHAYEAGIAVTEAWFWLEGQGLLVPLIGLNNTPTPEARVLSRRGQTLAREPRPALGARLLSKNTLHPAIREEVWSLFHRGKYDAAVFEAMKAVEIAVREAANLKPTDVGVDLMRKAFRTEGGPLTDMSVPPAEREARSALFAGAMGSYKNPQSHRKVDLDNPDEAAEIIMLACHLLRIVTDRNSVFS